MIGNNCNHTIKSSMIIHPDELSVEWIDRLVSAGVSTIGIHPPGGKDAADTLRALLQAIETKKFRDMIDYAQRCGLEVEYEIHSAGYLMPRDLFSEHPEYFRMNSEGQRVNDWNFCVSNPDALDLFAKRAAELALSLYGSGRSFYFWMDDGHDIHCRCPKCLDLSPSDQQMIAINRMISEIRKYIPDARMAYLAYIDSIRPPVKVNPTDGVFLEYAPFAKYTARGDDAETRISQEKEMIAPLMRCFGAEPKKVLEYWYDNSLFSRWKKPPARFVLNEKDMRHDIAEYRGMGFDYISTFACFLGKDYEELYGEADVTPFGNMIKQ